MNPYDFMNTALLLKVKSDEASLRSAVSRAYYAIYDLLKEDIVRTIRLDIRQSCKLSVRNDDVSHQKLPELLKAVMQTTGTPSNPAPLTSSEQHDLNRIGTELDRLRVARHKADYEMTCIIDARYAGDRVQDAQDLKALIDGIGGSRAVIDALNRDLLYIHGP